MRYFTEEEIKALEQYNIVKHFKTAIYDHYIVGLRRIETEIITEVFKQANNNQDTLYNWNCNTCALKNCRQVGKHYFASLQELEKQIEETIQREDNNNTVSKTTKDDGNKKKGRPRKKKNSK